MASPSGALRLAFGGAVALAAAMGVGRFAYTPILPAMVAELGLSKAEAGALVSFNVVGYLAGALLASLRVLRGSQRIWLLGALALGAASTTATGATNDFTALCAIRFAGGFSSALVLVFASSLVLDRLAAAGRTDLSWLYFSGVGAGIVLSALLVEATTRGGGRWHALWFGVGGLAALAVPAVVLLIPADRRDAAAAPPDAAPAPRLGLPLCAVMAAYFLFGLGYTATTTFLVAMVREMPIGGGIEPVTWLVVGLAACPSLLLWNILARRIGVVRAFGLALLVEAAAVAWTVAASGALGILVAAALLGGTFVPITAFGLVAARALAPGGERRVAAAMTSVFGTGSVVSPPVAGLMVDLTGGFALPTYMAAAALALGALVSQGGRLAAAARVPVPPACRTGPQPSRSARRPLRPSSGSGRG